MAVEIQYDKVSLWGTSIGGTVARHSPTLLKILGFMSSWMIFKETLYCLTITLMFYAKWKYGTQASDINQSSFRSLVQMIGHNNLFSLNQVYYTMPSDMKCVQS